LVLSGDAYHSMTFETLHGRLCDALRGGGPRVVAAALIPSGGMRIVFEDGTAKEVDV
jgi:hypothetical protein